MQLTEVEVGELQKAEMSLEEAEASEGPDKFPSKPLLERQVPLLFSLYCRVPRSTSYACPCMCRRVGHLRKHQAYVSLHAAVQPGLLL